MVEDVPASESVWHGEPAKSISTGHWFWAPVIQVYFLYRRTFLKVGTCQTWEGVTPQFGDCWKGRFRVFEQEHVARLFSNPPPPNQLSNVIGALSDLSFTSHSFLNFENCQSSQNYLSAEVISILRVSHLCIYYDSQIIGASVTLSHYQPPRSMPTATCMNNVFVFKTSKHCTPQSFPI